jgi:hypothetical protein
MLYSAILLYVFIIFRRWMGTGIEGAVWGLHGNKTFMCIMPVIVEEDAIVTDCRGIERMGIKYKVGKITYLVSGFYRRDSDSVGKVR